MFLEVEDLVKFYGEGENRVKVLKGISTGVEKGEMCVIQGPSGSGKSTFLNCIGGLEVPDGGSIKVDGTEIAGMSQDKLSDYRRDKLGFIFQFYNVVFSDRQLPIDSGKLLSTVSRAQIEQAGHVFVDLMASMIYTMTIVSGFIFFVVLYLMMGVMVDRASYDISLMKIFGYRRGEIRKLYLNGNMYFVALGSLIAIPLAKKTIDAIYPYFISNVACAMDLSMSPLVYVGLFVVIMGMYFVINALLVRKIDRVTPAEVLKNRE